MIKNFSIDQSIALVLDEELYDLHNFYSIVGLSLAEAKKVLIQFAQRGMETTASLELHFHEVDFLSTDFSAESLNDMTVDEFGFKPPDDFDYDWLYDESEAKEDSHMFIRLVGDGYIRVHAERVEFRKIESS